MENNSNSKSNTTLLGLIATVLFILIIATGGLIYVLYSLPKDGTATSKQPAVTSETTWQTYTTNAQMDLNSDFYALNKNTGLPKITFQYPSTWKVNTYPDAKSTNTKMTSLNINLEKLDPKKGNCQGEGPCENSAYIQFSVGILDNPIDEFQASFWGRSFPIEKREETTVNNIPVVKAYATKTSLYPNAVLFIISPSMQLVAWPEQFNLHDTNYQDPFNIQTAQEINQIIESINIIKP